MRVDAFDYILPEARIATHPAEPRETARLLHVADSLTDYTIADLPQLLQPNDILIFNNTKVIPARFRLQKGEGAVEITLLKALPAASEDQSVWHAMAKPAKKLEVGTQLHGPEGMRAAVQHKGERGEVTLAFSFTPLAFREWLQTHGALPLPPYILKKRALAGEDTQDYQTVFARHEGAVAAPTAGLHFTPSLLASIRARGITTAEVTLHVGAGTFLPVTVEDTADHVMHAEWCELPAETVAAIQAARAKGGRVVAVGTTSLRTLEGAFAACGALQAWQGDTQIFITPGYHFNVVNVLLTNFHLPRSTLLMLVSAFAGTERIRSAYAHAIANGYRFYSYGDACLLERA